MVSLPASNEYEQSLPSPSALLQELPLSQESLSFILETRQTISNILNGNDPRTLLIVGPCSIHDKESSLEYAMRLQALSAKVSDQFFIVMRSYFEKPRTVYGWKGYLYDPYLDGSHDIASGLYLTRQLLLELAEQKIPVATELLEIITAPYLTDLISWGCIGARTSNSPPHRQLAASLPFPVGFKNTTCGSILNAVNGCLSASSAHSFMSLNEEGELVKMYSPGNSNCHVVLRGGESGSNYDLLSIEATALTLKARALQERVVVDCSHDNSQKNPAKQLPIFGSLINRIAEKDTLIRGIMLESHLHEGRQKLTKTAQELKYGVSITDPCISFKTTEELILEGHAKLQEKALLTL